MKGWHRDNYRHSLSARGIRTSFTRRYSFDDNVLGFIRVEKRDAREIPLESFKKYIKSRSDNELIDILNNKKLTDDMSNILKDEIGDRRKIADGKALNNWESEVKKVVGVSVDENDEYENNDDEDLDSDLKRGV